MQEIFRNIEYKNKQANSRKEKMVEPSALMLQKQTFFTLKSSYSAPAAEKRCFTHQGFFVISKL